MHGSRASSAARRRRARRRARAPHARARAPAVPFLNRVAQASRHVDRRLRAPDRVRLARAPPRAASTAAVDALELGEQHEGLCAQRVRSRLREQLGRRSCARGSTRRPRDAREPRRALGDARSSRALGGRQPERLLGELRRDGAGAAIAGQRRGRSSSDRGHLCVRRVGRRARGDGRARAGRRRCRAIRA